MKKFPVSVVLDNIRSALNVGAIFRTCDAAGIEKLYLCGITPYPPHNRIPKTALGAVETVRWEYGKNTIETVEKLKEEKKKIISVEVTDNAIEFTDYKFTTPSVLIFGNEINGVGEEILKLSDGIVKIPMFGMKESLNVATTSGIVIYEAVRQIRKLVTK
ncbi:TrmH family RNA methyltransferase [Candidatus Dojkabacteria bacterium]|nr:TrmH family RNA methyltransferase [Candidatus Dojkabacteria bacterium]